MGVKCARQFLMDPCHSADANWHKSVDPLAHQLCIEGIDEVLLLSKSG